MIGFADTSIGELGLSLSVTVDGLTGAARASVELRLSPGRDGFGPDFTLGYDSGASNSPFGLGWTLSGLPTIAVDTRRGLPRYDDRDGYVHGGTELVAVPGVPRATGGFTVERFRARVERSYERFERWTGAGGRAHWRRLDRDGSVHVFGAAADDSTRIADLADPDRRTFVWLLEASYDRLGNAVSYSWKAESAQRYLKHVDYANSRSLSADAPTDPANRWRLRVVFDYGEHTGPVPGFAEAVAWPERADSFSQHRAGFEVRTRRLCRRVLMFHDIPELGAKPTLVGATELGHRQDPAGSVLERVGYRGYRTESGLAVVTDRAVPPIELRSSVAEPALGFEAADGPAPIEGGHLVDLLGEGLPGFLAERDGGWFFAPGLGDGRFGPAGPVAELPASPTGARQLADFDGDGNVDLVGWRGREAGFYRRDRLSGRWDGYRAFGATPSLDFAIGRAQLVDLSGDGEADLAAASEAGPVWYPSLGTGGFGAAAAVAIAGQAGRVPAPVADRLLGTFLADMSGDGLLDLVRVGDGRVEYHPNLGFGRFGDPVLMDDSPSLGGFGRFDPARVRLADLDRSGTADLVYLDDGEVRCWTNRCGNGFGPAVSLGRLPWIDDLASAWIGDFLGDGTSCLVWTAPGPSGRAEPSFLRLSGALPPRLLVGASNGMGLDTTLEWRSSGRDFLRDRAEGRPWRDRLPQHVMVVGRRTSTDTVAGMTLSARYSYHDGHYDDAEHRLVGFARTDAWDSTDAGTQAALTRSWYLTGDPDDHAAGPVGSWSGDSSAMTLAAPSVEGAATTAELLAGHRALAGLPWRTEVFPATADGGPGPVPFAVESLRHRAVRLHGDAFALSQAELLRSSYELNADDPRVEHELVLALGDYGDVTRRASVAYPRRAGPATRPEQRITIGEVTDATFLNLDTSDRYETGIPVQKHSWALHGLGAEPFTASALADAVGTALADELGPYESQGGGLQARPTAWSRIRYWDDGLMGALPLGEAGAVLLCHHEEHAVIPEDADAWDGHAGAAELTAAGYALDGGWWWAPGPVTTWLGPDDFYRPSVVTSALGVTTRLTHDPHRLAVIETTDGADLTSTATLDYHVLAALATTDANGTVAEVRYDPLGIAVLAGQRGRVLGADDAGHPAGARPLHGLPELDLDVVLAGPAAAVGTANTLFAYDLWAPARGEGPARTLTVERECHADDGEGGALAASPVRITLAYTDGFGRQVQGKIAAGPGRWLVSGHEQLDDKGRQVRRFEPFFSATPAFEDAAPAGVATTTSYDATGRVIGAEQPDGTRTRTTYAAWSVTDADENDTVAGSDWEAERAGLPLTDPRRRALDQALGHDGTVTVTEVDPAGRSYRVTQLGEAGRELVTTTTLGDLTEDVTDPRALPALAVRRDLTGATVRERTPDAGTRWELADADGNPAARWRERTGGVVRTRFEYDAAGRHTGTRVDGPTGLGLGHLVELIVYGDAPVGGPDRAALRGALGRVVAHFDTAGVRRMLRHDVDGNAVEVTRTLRHAFTGTPDWTDPAAVELQDSVHTTIEVLDALGRVVSQALPDDTTREFEYAPSGELARVLLSTADRTIDREVVADRIGTNARGQREALKLGNGVELGWAYDPRSFRLDRLTANAPGGPRLMDVGYAYDPSGNVTSVLDRAQLPAAVTPLLTGRTVSPVREYTYDPLYRLRSATGRVHQALLAGDATADGKPPGPFKGTRHLALANGAAVERYTRTYAYDDNGNLLTTRHKGQTHTWKADMWVSATSNRSVPNGVANPESQFDAAGYLLALPTMRALDWDHDERLVRAVLIERAGQPDDAEYHVHDAEGRRIRRVAERLLGAGLVERVDTVFLDGCELRTVTVDGVVRLARATSHLTDGSARLATLHRWTADTLATETDEVTAMKWHYVVGDHLSSAALELDETGAVISYEEYLPYGGTGFIAGDSPRAIRLKDYRYCGKVTDDATGLVDFGLRLYAPWLGRWLRPDPIGTADGLNQYHFCHGNPINFVDADGLKATRLKVKQEYVTDTPADVQRQLDNDPGLRRRFDAGEITFRRTGESTFTSMTKQAYEAWVRSENAAGRVPSVATLADLPVIEIKGPLTEAAEAAARPPAPPAPAPAPAPAPGLGQAPEPPAEQGARKGRKQADAAHPATGTGQRKPGDASRTDEHGNGDATRGTAPRAQRRSQGVGQGQRVPGTLRPGTDPAPGRDERPEPGATEPGGTGAGGQGGTDDTSRSPTSQAGQEGGEFRTGSPDQGDRRGNPALDPGAPAADGDDRNGRKGTWWDTVVRWAGYANFTFHPEPGGEDGGIPGGFGGLHGTGAQVLYVVVTLISTVMAAWSIYKSIAVAGVRQLLAGIWRAIRSPLVALRELWAVMKGFGAETAEAATRTWGATKRVWNAFRQSGSFRTLWNQAFRTGRWEGPLGWVTRLFKGSRNWGTEQAFRDHTSWLFKPRWFGKLPLYNTEHIATQSGAVNAASAAVRNGLWNTWLKLPMTFNSSLQNRLVPRLFFYSGLIQAAIKSAFAGWWAGQQIGQKLTEQPPAPASP